MMPEAQAVVNPVLGVKRACRAFSGYRRSSRAAVSGADESARVVFGFRRNPAANIQKKQEIPIVQNQNYQPGVYSSGCTAILSLINIYSKRTHFFLFLRGYMYESTGVRAMVALWRCLVASWPTFIIAG
jgi:hypothetical protein